MGQIGNSWQYLDVSAVVLTGSDEVFSAGANISPGDALRREHDTLLDARQAVRVGPDMCAAWEKLEQVTIAAIEGHCIGGAAALVAACDFRICGAGAKVRLPEVALGLNMSWQSLPRFVALIGPSRTKRLVILCDEVRADEALTWGLVDEVVDDGEALDEAMNLARKITALPPLPVRMSKQAINEVALAHAKSTIYMDRDQVLATMHLHDFREGVAAFLDKREPKFTGN